MSAASHKEAFHDPVGAAPDTRSPRFLWLLLGVSAAPAAWVVQIVLAYGITALVCFPADHPLRLAAAGPLFAAMVALDLLAFAACAGGGYVSWRLWRQVRRHEGRNSFLALWGTMLSLWFAAAVLFNAIASVVVPPCRF